MSTNSQSSKPFQGIKRNAQGQLLSQNKQELGLSPELRHVLDQMSTLQLVSVFEPAIREHLRQRIPTMDLDRAMEKVKTETNREKIMRLVSLLPQVMAGLRESHQRQGTSNPLAEPARTQPEDVPMNILPHASPPTPCEVHLAPTGASPSLSHPPSSNTTPNPPKEATGPATPPRDTTIFSGLCTPGKGKNKTSEKEFTISEDNYVRARAWARRILRFDRSNEHLMYRLKPVLSSDVQALLDSLRAIGVVDPLSQDPGTSNVTESQEEHSSVKQQYDRIVAQSIYMLPTSWPPSADFLIDLNQDKSLDLSPKDETEPYVDVTEIIKKGLNLFTLVEFKDMRSYTFCLFEKCPTDHEIEEAALL